MISGVFHRKNSVSVVLERNPAPTDTGVHRSGKWEDVDFAFPEPARLTKRETEVLWLVAFGHTDESIAVLLGNKRPTISNHVQSILRKLDAPGRAAAVWQGVRLGILSPDGVGEAPRSYVVRCSCGKLIQAPYELELRSRLRRHFLHEHDSVISNPEIDRLIKNSNEG